MDAWLKKKPAATTASSSSSKTAANSDAPAPSTSKAAASGPSGSAVFPKINVKSTAAPVGEAAWIYDTCDDDGDADGIPPRPRQTALGRKVPSEEHRRCSSPGSHSFRTQEDSRQRKCTPPRPSSSKFDIPQLNLFAIASSLICSFMARLEQAKHPLSSLYADSSSAQTS